MLRQQVLQPTGRQLSHAAAVSLPLHIPHPQPLPSRGSPIQTPNGSLIFVLFTANLNEKKPSLPSPVLAPRTPDLIDRLMIDP